mmetsp:Transcript_77279/g.198928  ORF Transcript_77279/g.198928 Transcript_77279/m.198928 type:complete len:214 (-) Transcript_77279:423-1064(-)
MLRGSSVGASSPSVPADGRGTSRKSRRAVCGREMWSSASRSAAIGTRPASSPASPRPPSAGSELARRNWLSNSPGRKLSWRTSTNVFVVDNVRGSKGASDTKEFIERSWYVNPSRPASRAISADGISLVSCAWWIKVGSNSAQASMTVARIRSTTRFSSSVCPAGLFSSSSVCTSCWTATMYRFLPILSELMCTKFRKSSPFLLRFESTQITG